MLLRSVSIREANKYDHVLNDSDEDEPLNSSSYKNHDPKGNTKLSIRDRIPEIEKKLYTNIFILVPVIFVVSLLFGTLFYRVHHGWELSTSFYFSSQVLAGTYMINR